jgi:hypothetical protein
LSCFANSDDKDYLTASSLPQDIIIIIIIVVVFVKTALLGHTLP